MRSSVSVPSVSPSAIRPTRRATLCLLAGIAACLMGSARPVQAQTAWPGQINSMSSVLNIGLPSPSFKPGTTGNVGGTFDINIGPDNGSGRWDIISYDPNTQLYGIVASRANPQGWKVQCYCDQSFGYIAPTQADIADGFPSKKFFMKSPFQVPTGGETSTVNVQWKFKVTAPTTAAVSSNYVVRFAPANPTPGVPDNLDYDPFYVYSTQGAASGGEASITVVNKAMYTGRFYDAYFAIVAP